MPVCSGPMSPRVALLSPFAFPSVRGNAVTVARVARGLRARGVELDVWDLSRERVLLAFPAGIRMVKRPRFPLQPLERVVARRPSVRLLYVGPVLDADERDALHRALEGRPWARWIGPVPHAQMGSLLALGDVVLNCSISEGGMSNSRLEAVW